jgi:hypothetical protein
MIKGCLPICDVSWQHDNYNLHVNPLAIGQIVNNCTRPELANVAYEELNIHPDTYCQHDHNDIIALLPNINYEFCNFLRLVPLIAIRDIETHEELFSTYFTLIKKS